MRSHVGWHAGRPGRSASFSFREIFAGIASFFLPAWTERKQARFRITTMAVIYICCVGVINIWRARHVYLEPLYLLGSVYAGWAGGQYPVLAVTFASALPLFWDATPPGLEGTTGSTLYCNGILHLTLVSTAGWTAAWVRNLKWKLNVTGRKLANASKEADKEQKETTTRLREVVDLFSQVSQATGNSSAVFWVSDPTTGRITYISPGYEKVWQRPRWAAYKNPDTGMEGVHPEDIERVMRARAAKEGDGEYDEEFRLLRPDGSMRWVHDRTFPLRNDQGEIYRIVGISEDITERKRAAQLLETQRDIGIELSLISDLKFGLGRLLARAAKLDGLDCGAVYLANLETGTLNLEAHFGLSPYFVERNSRYKPESVEARTLGCGSLQYIVCGPEPVYAGGLWRGAGIRGMAIVPLKHKGTLFGTLNLASRRHDEIPAATRLVIETIAAQASDAIARLRLEREILEVSDREKARIGQDVHDGLCQQLVGAAFDANSLLHKLEARSQAEATLARRIFLLLQEAITESRGVAHGLYPVRLEKEGLVPALQELANRTSERFNLTCTCEAKTVNSQFDSTTATHLYRIAQEAVNNAVKHSGAKKISIVFTEEADAVTLEVADDGTGLAEHSTSSCGMGLHIMDYRARTIGGVLDMRGNGSGTIVSCRLPAAIFRT